MGGDQQGDLQRAGRERQRRDAEHACRDHQQRRRQRARGAARGAAQLRPLRPPADQRRQQGARRPGRRHQPFGGVDIVAEAGLQKGRRPGDQHRQPPIGDEPGDEDAEHGRAGEKTPIGHAIRAAARRGDHRLVDLALAAEGRPGGGPDQSDDAEQAEGGMPAIGGDDVDQHRCGDDHADAGADGDDGGGQRAPVVGKPFVEGM